MPITLLPSMPTSIILGRSGASTGLHTGFEPLLPFVFRTAKKPAGLQISTVVKDLPGPRGPAGASFSRRPRQHAIRDPGIPASERRRGRGSWVPALAPDGARPG